MQAITLTCFTNSTFYEQTSGYLSFYFHTELVTMLTRYHIVHVV